MIAVALRAALGIGSDPARIMTAGTGLFMAVVGNYLGKLRRGRWVGIRTPWTLADDEVWLRTHRLGGWLLVPTGALSCLAALAGAPVRIACASWRISRATRFRATW